MSPFGHPKSGFLVSKIATWMAPATDFSLLSPAPPLCICFVLYTFGYSTGNSPSYRTTLVQSTRFASPFSVQPMAVTMLCPVALDFMSQKAPVGTQLCAKSRESPAPPYHLPHHPHQRPHHSHGHMYTATWLTLCLGWRVGIVQANVIVTASAVSATAGSASQPD